ncbi:MAG: hypothetical protein A2622_06425 [Bdellovibrionales bacterium RIFCSPHIGHO2_01_FULL_40_29]|nr:MAG: hypothetical protein A2622_06425 [Bdellovibrionales bacterium RIFCSPHIGHO2_01_FULL_40_29]OFZ35079.1 MAG: hypothetical protein A3D17_06775 [Bdellovibrionales bacterium RIFCSPHIGHO2_02_FULL_40_15]
MKVILAVLVLIASVSSFAQMTVFSNQDALKLVMTDDSILEAVYAQSGTNNLMGLSVLNSDFNAFEVEINTNIEDKDCRTSVLVEAELVHARIPGGGQITANKLVAKKIFKSICEGT